VIFVVVLVNVIAWLHCVEGDVVADTPVIPAAVICVTTEFDVGGFTDPLEFTEAFAIVMVVPFIDISSPATPKN
jgi:hypothetical protein